MSAIIFVVNVIDTDLVTPSKIYEDAGHDFDKLYAGAIVAAENRCKKRKNFNKEKFENHFAKYAREMEANGGFIYVYNDNSVEVYCTRYELSVNRKTKKRARLDKPPELCSSDEE